MKAAESSWGETLQPSASAQALQKTQSQTGREAASLYQESHLEAQTVHVGEAIK